MRSLQVQILTLLWLTPLSAHAVCDPNYPITPIHAVQGSGSVSPLADRLVMIEGIVVGDFQGGPGANGELDGFAVQEQWPEADLDAFTSEGVFVHDGAAPSVDVALGDQVCVLGRVSEAAGETRIDVAIPEGNVAVISTGNRLPWPRRVRFPVVNTHLNDDGQFVPDLERFEGERVRISGRLTVTQLNDLDLFGEVTLSSGGRLTAFTHDNAPDPAGFAAWTEDAARRSLTIDDGLRLSWPDPIPYPPPALGLANVVRVGDSISRLLGVLTYGRGNGPDGRQTYRLMPTVPPRILPLNRRPLTAPRVRGDVTVASFNLRFFLNGSGGDPDSFPIGSGQTTYSEYLRQRAKLIATIAELDADIVGLVELENDYLDGPGSAIADLVAGLNAMLGAGTYAYRDPNEAFGTSPLMNGILYKPATVTPVGPLVWLYSDEFANPNGNIFKLNRPALTQTFDTAIGAFTVSVNHFKSKGCGPSPTGLDIDQNDGAACFNDTRAKGATALLDWLANDPTDTQSNLGDYDPDILIIGDLNAHLAEAPIDRLLAGWDGTPGTADDWIDLLTASDYSFVFRGQASRLDYAIASPSLAVQVSRAAVWRVNSEESDAFDYAEDHPAPAALYAPDPFRSSDHDVVLIGLSGTP